MSPKSTDKLAECRRQIDALDVQIVDLLNARTEVVHEIGRIKRQYAMPIYEPKREDQVFENVTGHNPGPLTADALKRIFERIIDEMRTIQQKRTEHSEIDGKYNNNVDQ